MGGGVTENPGGPRRATMMDVAKAADVSLKTVSRFVNGETNISPVIAARVADAIRALSFRRNLAAASIRPGQRTQLVGLIIEDLANPFYAALTRSVELELRATGMLLLAASSEEDSDLHCRLVEQLIERRADGLIVVPPSVPGDAWARLAAEVPALVMLDRVDPGVDSDAIVADDEDGGRSATALLIAHGARHVAFVGEHLSLPTIAGRHRGHLAALAEAGLAADPALTIDQVRTPDEVADAVAGLLRSGRPVDAVFASNNRASIGTLKAFRALGTRRALVGFDDFEAAPLVEPAVTVVTHDVGTMGRLAAQALLARIGGSRAPSVHTVLPTMILARGSERPPA